VIPAIVTAGDRGAAKAVRGQSKVYLEVGGRELVARVVVALQSVPEVSEVWVVGDAQRLEAVFRREELRAELRKPLHIVEQFGNLYENCWETYRRALPGAGSEGRDPVGEDLDFQVLYLSADLPFATPEEISAFIRESQALECDYALRLITRESLADFLPESPGGVGIDVAYFNMREGRLRQSNLHLARPGRMGARELIEEMYEHRHQKQLGDIVGLAWTIIRKEEGGMRILGYYLLIHLAGVADRRGWHGTADRLRGWIPLERIAAACSSLLRADFRFAITDVGGCGVDIDNEHDYDVARRRYGEWMKAQAERAEKMYGAPSSSGSHGNSGSHGKSGQRAG